ncbi:cysteine-rich repeat secretory protein 38-like isoform X1 [Vicia villosa]|uniref:cysteine-rich repeat secretory protein 38-like isoform X1 n=1 Tax=Vicia villosa TaxID=3911 RepID=UPI00273B3BCD|nr:cysteine-rich repeat secretory protein 38-like isoform X1 [Vicia villosa]
MLSLRCLLFLSLPLFFTLNSQANDQLVFRYHKCNNDLGNFTDGSTYQNNLATVLKNIYSNKEIDYGFYNFSYGQKPDKVSAIGFCRGDLNPNDCRDCLKSSAVLLTDRCPIQKEAIGYYDLCMLRYSNASIFGVMDTDTGYVYDIENKTGVDDAFSQTLNGLLDELKSTAAEGDWRKKFGIKSVKVNESNNNNNETIYGLVQCTPDLTKKSCTKCLDSAYGKFSTWCKDMKGCLYMGPSCSVRYDIVQFYQSIVNRTESPAPRPSQALPPKSASTNSTESPAPQPSQALPPKSTSTNSTESPASQPSQALAPKTASTNSTNTESPAPQPSQTLAPKTASTNSTNTSPGLGKSKKLRTVITIGIVVVAVFGLN